jgi:hypothetical protein
MMLPGPAIIFLKLDMCYLPDRAQCLPALDHVEEDPHCHQPININKPPLV